MMVVLRDRAFMRPAALAGLLANGLLFLTLLYDDEWRDWYYGIAAIIWHVVMTPLMLLEIGRGLVNLEATKHLCAACGYDQRGLTTPVCPECGASQAGVVQP